jgi:hypothetical protein
VWGESFEVSVAIRR